MIILASASPRRKEILEKNNVKFKCIPSNVVEVVDKNLTPRLVVMDLAYQKANDVYQSNQDDFVIGSDTIVVLDNEILGKPVDFNDAFNMLKKLQGREHYVMTGVAYIYQNKVKKDVSISKVYFKKMTDEEVIEYINTKEPFGKAGSYAIQGEGGKYIDHFEGDYYTIVGLPIDLVLEELKKYNLI